MAVENPEIIGKPFLNSPVSVNSLVLLIPILTVLGNWILLSIYILVIFIVLLASSLSLEKAKLKVPFLFIWCILLIWGIFVAARSPSMKEGIAYFVGIILIPFLIFIILNNISFSINFLNRLFNLFIVAGVILGFSSFLIFMGSGFDFTLRIPSLWVDYNIVSLYMLIIFMFNFSFIINRNKGEPLLLYVISLFIILFGIVLTQTRGVWLSLIFAIVLFLIKRPKIIFPIMIVMGIFSIFFFQVFQDRFLSVKNFGSDQSSLGRLQAWLSSIELIKENFLLGSGFNSYIYLRDQVYAFYFVEVLHSHNTYLRIILEMGFIGFLLYFLFLFSAARFVFSKKVSDEVSYKKFTDGFKLTFFAFIPAFMFEPYFSLYGCSTIVIWVLISLCFKIYSEVTNNTKLKENYS